MATLTIPDLPDEVHEALRARAARNGRSPEAEVRLLIAEAVAERAAPADDVRARVKRLQDMVARHVPPGSYSVDRFLAERREEAALEEARFERWEREAAEARTKSPRG
jgi:plasmid stability protein